MFRVHHGDDNDLYGHDDDDDDDEDDLYGQPVHAGHDDDLYGLNSDQEDELRFEGALRSVHY